MKEPTLITREQINRFFSRRDKELTAFDVVCAALADAHQQGVREANGDNGTRWFRPDNEAKWFFDRLRQRGFEIITPRPGQRYEVETGVEIKMHPAPEPEPAPEPLEKKAQKPVWVLKQVVPGDVIVHEQQDAYFRYCITVKACAELVQWAPSLCGPVTSQMRSISICESEECQAAELGSTSQIAVERAMQHVREAARGFIEAANVDDDESEAA